MTTGQARFSRRALLAGLAAVPALALTTAPGAVADTASPSPTGPALDLWPRRAVDAFDLLVTEFGHGATLAAGLLPAIPEREGDADQAPLRDLLDVHQAARAVATVDPGLISGASDRAAEIAALVAQHRETDPPTGRAAGYLPHPAASSAGEPVLDYADNALVGLMQLAESPTGASPATGADSATGQLSLLNVSGWDADLDHVPAGGVRQSSAPQDDRRSALATFTMVRLAAQLAGATGMTGYADLARRGWDWGQALLTDDGQVQRSVSASGAVDPTRGGAQQGAAIKAALDLWEVTGQQQYQDAAVRLAPVAIELLQPTEVVVRNDRITRPPVSPDSGTHLVTALVRLSAATDDGSFRSAAVDYANLLWRDGRVGGNLFRTSDSPRTSLSQQTGLARTAAALATGDPLRGY